MKRPTFGAVFCESLKAIGKDFAEGRVFWVAVVLSLLPCILLATKFRSNLPQLVVAAEISQQQFAQYDQPFQQREDFLRDLGFRLQQDLTTSVCQPFTNPEPEIPGNLERIRYEDKARFLIKARVTNFGTITSTVSSVTANLIQNIDGRKLPIGFADWPQKDLVLPPGQITPLGKRDGQWVEFDFLGESFVDFQIAELLGRVLRERYPKEIPKRHQLLDAYVSLLPTREFDTQELRRSIANPVNEASVSLVLQVTDIYGRSGVAECPIITSGAWK